MNTQEKITNYLSGITDSRTIPAISLTVGKSGCIVYSKTFGRIYETGKQINNNSVFDIASMTKIFSGICFMYLVEHGLININDPLSNIFPEFKTKKPLEKDGEIIGYCDAGEITWYNVLTHTTGMGWTRPKTRPSLPGLDKGLEVIFSLPFAYAPGTQVVYSDIPIILLGKAIEIITEKPLDAVVEDIICEPLELLNTGYRRLSGNYRSLDNVVPTENDVVFRKKRIWGEVHDENAYQLDGVSAHAGIFSTSEDICRLMMEYGLCLERDGILKKETVRNMIDLKVHRDWERRGLIWQLSWSGENAYTRFLSPGSYGHSGFTGCFGWNDPEKDLTIVLLSNDVYNGRDDRKLFEYRSSIMEMIAEDCW